MFLAGFCNECKVYPSTSKSTGLSIVSWGTPQFTSDWPDFVNALRSFCQKRKEPSICNSYNATVFKLIQKNFVIDTWVLRINH